MAIEKKYWGSINLNSIKEAIEGGVKPFEGKKGKYLDISVAVFDQPDQFGNICAITVWNKETKQATYLANLKESDFSESPAKADTPDTDLPF